LCLTAGLSLGACSDDSGSLSPACPAGEAVSQAECEAGGGQLEFYYLVGGHLCTCPTSDGGDRCETPSACESSCVAPIRGLGPNGCDGVQRTYCGEVSPLAGCFCWRLDDGSIVPLCSE
ncbi:unnamed protein product, partial [Laminaria digitata]